MWVTTHVISWVTILDCLLVTMQEHRHVILHVIVTLPIVQTIQDQECLRTRHHILDTVQVHTQTHIHETQLETDIPHTQEHLPEPDTLRIHEHLPELDSLRIPPPIQGRYTILVTTLGT